MIDHTDKSLIFSLLNDHLQRFQMKDTEKVFKQETQKTRPTSSTQPLFSSPQKKNTIYNRSLIGMGFLTIRAKLVRFWPKIKKHNLLKFHNKKIS